MRQATLPGLEDCCQIPVEVRQIALRQGVEVREDLPPSAKKEAELIAGRDRFTVRLPSTGIETRKRLSLAHELGHTLFYCGYKHQIGSLSLHEINAEEDICWSFATALLMPAATVKSLFPPIAEESPWSVVSTLERGAKRLNVSMSSLISRLGHVNPGLGSFVLVCSKLMENRRTGSDPQLRVTSSCASAYSENAASGTIAQ